MYLHIHVVALLPLTVSIDQSNYYCRRRRRPNCHLIWSFFLFPCVTQCCLEIIFLFLYFSPFLAQALSRSVCWLACARICVCVYIYECVLVQFQLMLLASVFVCVFIIVEIVLSFLLHYSTAFRYAPRFYLYSHVLVCETHLCHRSICIWWWQITFQWALKNKTLRNTDWLWRLRR